MSIRNVLAAATAALGLAACGPRHAIIEEIDSCDSNNLHGSVHLRDYGQTASILLYDHTTDRQLSGGGYVTEGRYYREFLVAGEDDRNQQTGLLTSQMNAYCRSGETPDNEGIASESLTMSGYECLGTSLNQAKVEIHEGRMTLLTGNLDLARPYETDGTLTRDAQDGITSRQVNVYGFEEARDLARAHCAAPSVSSP